MHINSFNNLPKINKKEAINTLEKAIDEVKYSADYYKAVFHLANFPCEECEDVLLKFIKIDYKQLEFKIAKRKAIEVLAFFDCKKAIPTLADFLNNDDPYLVETAIWSLGKLKCNDIHIINQICSKLYKHFNNKRVVIQVLTNLGVKKEIEKIRSLLKDNESSNGVRGASLAALIKLAGEEEKLTELKEFLRLPNQNDRHCAVQDIINAGNCSIIPSLVKAPISPSFKLHAIESLWINESLLSQNVNLLRSIESIIIDDPNIINTLEIYDFEKNINFLIEQLFHTDFNRCYTSMKVLKKYPSKEVFYYLNLNWDKAKVDYGALYFFINAYKHLLEKGFYHESILEKVEFLLSDQWPNHMKFKSSAMQVLSYLDYARFYEKCYFFSDEMLTPFWKNRYAALLFLQTQNKIFDRKLVDLFLNDNHRFVRLKANQIFKF